MKIETGIIRVSDGVEQVIIVEAFRAYYPYDHVAKKVIAIPTKNGKASARYLKVKDDLGDDWDSDLTNTWFDAGELQLDDQLKILKILEELA